MEATAVQIDVRKDSEGWDKQVTDNFQAWEFRCRCCGLGDDEMQPEAIDLAQDVRTIIGVPIWLTSAFRCPARNKAEGGELTSQHLFGLACDMAKPYEVSWDKFLEAAVIATQRCCPDDVGSDPRLLGGIGIYRERNFIHIDGRTGPGARWYG